ncbi:hypothetical protein RHMOL_Rhmol11G0220900 [Rhododendron molle]|uniref:Uncharacterized protein n=1 Tax=Rhododendron molle TaxID=49168 RepID=A0ACC0LVZ0_RHOML|nr:hypothetical protein RHMOL_Rhmol11G0220900 [Rhododendron molle]
MIRDLQETNVSSILQAEAMGNLHACVLVKAMNLPRIEVQGDNKQVIKLLFVIEAEPRSLGMCFHCFLIFVLTDMEISLSFCWCSYILGRQTCLEVHLVGPLQRKGGFKINRDASLRAIFCVIRALRRNSCLFNFAGAKAMNLSSIEVQGDKKQVVKLLCVTEAEPSSLGMCFHCFQIFVLTDMEISLSFCWCSYILGRQTRRPTGLHNPLTRTNPRPFVLQDIVEKRKDDDSLNEENDLFAIIDTSMIGLKCMDPVWSLETSGQFLLQIIALLLRYISGHFSVLLLGGGYCRRGSSCRRWIYRVLNQSLFEVINLEVHLAGPLMRRGGFKINRDAYFRAIFCMIRALRRNPFLFNFAGAKAMNLSSIEVQGDNKQVVKLLCVTGAQPSSLGMCFHCFQIFVLRIWRYLFHFPGVLGRQTRQPTGLQNPLTRTNDLNHGFLALFWIFFVFFMLLSLLGSL